MKLRILYDKEVHECVWVLHIFNSEWDECKYEIWRQNLQMKYKYTF